MSWECLKNEGRGGALGCTETEAPPWSRLQGGLLLLVIVMLAGAALTATPALIHPFPLRAPWYESAASFPRLALVLVLIAGAAELVLRRKAQSLNRATSGSDELDSSTAQLPIALVALLLFVLYALAVPVFGFLLSTFTFLSACGCLLSFSLRQTLLLAIPLALGLWIVFVKVLKVAFGHGWFF